MHILIVDDEKSIRITLREFLLREGYKVDIAEDAETALKILEENKIDIVVTDILLPRISGVELLKSINDNYPRLQVIMITGEPNIETASQALRFGACDYLIKPVDKTSVLKAVENAVKIKKLEESNNAYRNNLEDLIKERTLDLELAIKDKERLYEQVIQQEKFAAVGKLLYGIAHDINNNLSPIMLYAEALQEKEKNLDDSSRKFIKNIIKSAACIESTILKINNFNRKKLIENPLSSIDMQKLITDTIEIFNNEKNIENTIYITIKAAERLPCINGNMNEMQTILLELLKNASDAMSNKGGINIEVIHDKENLIIEITDQGCGMTKEELRHCFDPFYTTKGPKYSGLGLSTVYGLVNSIGGTVEIKSRPEKGTKVRLIFKATDKGSAAEIS